MNSLITATVTLHFLVTSHALPTIIGLTLPELPILVDRIDKPTLFGYTDASDDERSVPLPVEMSKYFRMSRPLSTLYKEKPEILPIRTAVGVASPQATLPVPAEIETSPVISKRASLSINQELKTLARMLVSRDSRRRRNKADAVRSRLISLGKRSVGMAGSRTYVHSATPIRDFFAKRR